MKHHQANDSFVRRALTTNAVFSLATGLICLLAPSWVAAQLLTGGFIFERLTSPMLILDLGVGLVGFAAILFYCARRMHLNLKLIRLISIADFAWVAFSALVLLLAPGSLTSVGVMLVMAIAIIVLVLGIEQLIGAAITYQGASDISIRFIDGEMVLSAMLPTKATADRVWQVISHQESYADVADNISHVEIVAGKGEGMVRQCADKKGKTWRETCTAWDEGKGFAFTVHTDAPDYPYPIANLSGEWFLEPMAGGTAVRMIFKVQPKAGLINHLAFRAMAAPFAKICDRLLVRWVAIMEGRAAVGTGKAPRGILAPSSTST